MTLTTHVRFLDPIDPRDVWAMAQDMVGVPADYRFEYHRVGSPMWPGSELTNTNSGYFAEPDQGAGALLALDYGEEGSLLIDDPELEWPPAYVELTFDTPYGAAVDHRPWITHCINWAAQRGVRALWWEGECCQHWHPLVTPELGCP